MNAILFDLDNTLVDREATAARFLERQRARYADKLRSEPRAFIAVALKHQEGGYADKERAYRAACAELGESIDPQELLEDFRRHAGEDAIPMPGALATLESLAPRYRIAAVTNGRSSGQRRKIAACGFESLLDAIVISEEVGAKKPEEAIYRACLAALGLDPAACVFVGDHPLFDVEAPRALGMRAVWLRNARHPPPAIADATIDRLDQLPDILEGWRVAASHRPIVTRS